MVQKIATLSSGAVVFWVFHSQLRLAIVLVTKSSDSFMYTCLHFCTLYAYVSYLLWIIIIYKTIIKTDKLSKKYKCIE